VIDYVDDLLAILDLWGSDLLLCPEQPFHGYPCCIGTVELLTGFQRDGKTAQFMQANPFDVPIFQRMDDVFLGKFTDFDKACQ
jgi:hypothetical protein